MPRDLTTIRDEIRLSNDPVDPEAPPLPEGRSSPWVDPEAPPPPGGRRGPIQYPDEDHDEEQFGRWFSRLALMRHLADHGATEPKQIIAIRQSLAIVHHLADDDLPTSTLNMAMDVQRAAKKAVFRVATQYRHDFERLYREAPQPESLAWDALLFSLTNASAGQQKAINDISPELRKRRGRPVGIKDETLVEYRRWHKLKEEGHTLDQIRSICYPLGERPTRSAISKGIKKYRESLNKNQPE